MARTPHDDFGGQSDSLSTDQSTSHHLQAQAGGTLPLPGNEFASDAQMFRDGQDLILRAPDGNEITINNYFATEPAPMLVSEDGAALTPDLVSAFVTPLDGVQYAQKGSVDDESPVGIVKEANGESTITHANGVIEKIAVGTPVYEGDIIETKGNGAVNITFIDETTFAVSENARMAIDEYVFDPASLSGETNFSVLRGVFVFTSGLIGREDPDDVKIDTPVGSIGIRGTTIMGTINPDGESHVTVVEGAIVVKNGNGEQTLSQQFETVKLLGFNDALNNEGVLDAQIVSQNYNVLRAVSAPLFSTIDEAGKKSGDDQTQDTAPADDAPAQNDPSAIDADKKVDAADPNAQQETVAQSFTDPLALDDGLNAESGFDASAGINDTVNLIAGQTTIATTIAPTTAANFGTIAASTASPLITNAGDTLAPPSTLTPPANTAGGTTPPVTPPASDVFLNTIITGGSAQGITYIPSIAAGSQHGIAVTGIGSGGGAPLYAFINDTGQLFIDNFGGNLYIRDLATTPHNFANISGLALAGAGDFNADGTLDLAIAAPGEGTLNNGEVQIITNMATGAHITINGFADGYRGGSSIDNIGDFNGDGRSDLIIGAPAPSATGTAYVVFGTTATTISATSLTNGFSGIGAFGFSLAGGSGFNAGDHVTGLGDFDGDGFSDFAFSEPVYDAVNNTGAVKIFYGQPDTGQFTTNSYLLIDGIGVVDGDEDIPVLGLGDFNGDGFSDLGIGEIDATTNTLHIFYGSAARQSYASSGMGAVDISTSDVKITSAFKMIGGGTAGDFNGDGFDDIAIATLDGTNAHIYVVYGDAMGGSISLEGLSTDAQFHISIDLLAAGFGLTGPIVANDLDFSFDSAGDLNGDGFDDLIVGIADINNENGGVLLVTGRAENADITSGQVVMGNTPTAANQTIIGTAGADNMAAGAWNGTLIKAGGGNDIITIGGPGVPRGIDGGAGLDTATFLTSGGNIDLRAMTGGIQSIEQIRMDGTADMNLTIGIDDIFRLLQEAEGNNLLFLTTDTGNTLTIDNNGRNDNFDGGAGTPGDSLTDMGFTNAGTAGGYTSWTLGGYTLMIDTDITVAVTNVA